MGACVTEEQAIAHAQYLDLVYSQSGTLYELLPDAPRPGTSKTLVTPPVDDIIGYVSQTSCKSSPSPVKKKSDPSTDTASQPPSNPCKTVEVNVVQSTSEDKASKGKKKGKGKAKADTPKQDSPKTNIDDGLKRKSKYHCLICDDEHYTKDFP